MSKIAGRKVRVNDNIYSLGGQVVTVVRVHKNAMFQLDIVTDTGYEDGLKTSQVKYLNNKEVKI